MFVVEFTKGIDVFEDSRVRVRAASEVVAQGRSYERWEVKLISSGFAPISPDFEGDGEKIGSLGSLDSV